MSVIDEIDRILMHLIVTKMIFWFKSPEISQLSPLEKLDLINDNYKLSYSKDSKVLNPGLGLEMTILPWFDFLHYQTQIKTIINQDGLTIDLFTSDIKALLGYYYVLKQDEKVTQIGGVVLIHDYDKLLHVNVNAELFTFCESNWLKKSFLMDLEHYKSLESWYC